jgi:hypothetical protein
MHIVDSGIGIDHDPRRCGHLGPMSRDWSTSKESVGERGREERANRSGKKEREAEVAFVWARRSEASPRQQLAGPPRCSAMATPQLEAQVLDVIRSHKGTHPQERIWP